MTACVVGLVSGAHDAVRSVSGDRKGDLGVAVQGLFVFVRVSLSLEW